MITSEAVKVYIYIRYKERNTPSDNGLQTGSIIQIIYKRISLKRRRKDAGWK
jgi:hypothetical protein